MFKITLSASVVVIFWYLWYGFGYFLNSGTLGRKYTSLMPFDCFWIDFIQNIPGGKKRKIASIKQMVGNWNGIFATDNKSWEFEEIRQKNLFKECAMDILPSAKYFWFALSASLLIPSIIITHIVKFEPTFFSATLTISLFALVFILTMSFIASIVEKGDNSSEEIVKILSET